MFAREKGQHIEKQVSSYLQKQGMRLITRNYQCRGGEIDLIMWDRGTLVFVEVRYRNSGRFGSALESVNKTKQSRIIHTAEHYLLQSRDNYQACRFDVVAVSPAEVGYQFDWVKNAFQLG
ncbi:YraN family protein [Methylophaga sp.]|uniref:YraN family protein n=1 Tax=Methylophaga sp. TaxID=2024840 RepID=UPI003F6A42B4